MKRAFGRALRGLIVAVALAASIGAQGAATASAAAPDCAGRGVPDSKISIQLWTFAEYIGFGTDAGHQRPRRSSAGSATWATATSSRSLSGISAEAFRELLDKYGLKASARHVDIGTPENPADIEQIIADNKTLGIKYFGYGSTPIFPPIYTTEAEWVAYAEYLDEVGEQARKAGQRLLVHNHDIEFETVFGDQTVFDILMANTDPRNVVFQLDLYWADNGGADPIALIEEYGNRIQLFHVKDAARATAGSRSSARARSTSRRSSPRPAAAPGTTSSSTTRASATRRSTRSRRPRRASPTSTASPTDLLQMPKEDTRAQSTSARGPGRGPCDMRHPVGGVGPVAAARLAVPEGRDRPDAGRAHRPRRVAGRPRAPHGALRRGVAPRPGDGPEDARRQARRLPARRGGPAEHRPRPGLRGERVGLPLLLAAARHARGQSGDDRERGRRAVHGDS